uniref:C2 domain-containing protein n=1 Tax=Chromera velia CCMP2878 TaxID=1169474 RepID=A0A0G4HYF1_9ALVE|eukprot:Cvel_9478.t1-p1 / transcript=Cvel_9478.t1 / gene=Cvel_9478 / organism=Chromera_velia_CCMP2878 / gene_product=Centrosomal protein of 76 kDa, putative / transcript_product=Centrosomal protein of 76 kDa, putative / location=Cvel_scaffold547:43109-50481(+) / protein_length=1496 / sequence_SO=supercontig / SO=protein_coding / is_pseudo=false
MSESGKKEKKKKKNKHVSKEVDQDEVWFAGKKKKTAAANHLFDLDERGRRIEGGGKNATLITESENGSIAEEAKLKFAEDDSPSRTGKEKDDKDQAEDEEGNLDEDDDLDEEEQRMLDMAEEDEDEEKGEKGENEVEDGVAEEEEEEEFEFDLQNYEGLLELRAAEGLDPMTRIREWEITFLVHRIVNVTKEQREFFLGARFGHVNRQRIGAGTLRRMTLYTPMFSIDPNESRHLRIPLIFLKAKTVNVAQKDLGVYAFEFEAWRLNPNTFNSLEGTNALSLKQILTRSASMDIPIFGITQAGAAAARSGDKRGREVLILRSTLTFAEVFTFIVKLENLHFDRDPMGGMSEAEDQLAKWIRIEYPFKGRKRARLNSNYGEENFWEGPIEIKFKATRRQMQREFFLMTLQGNAGLGRSADLGSALLNLQGVLDYPAFTIPLRRLVDNPAKQGYVTGTLTGNVKVQMIPGGGDEPEDPKSRPEQPVTGASMVQELNLEEQFLVVQVWKCDSLPVADPTVGSSDPFVRVKWDAMCQDSKTIERSLRPVFNQSFYFPVRLIDDLERIDRLRPKLMPLDIALKGPLVLEVWDKDEAGADFLGSCQLDLASITAATETENRALADDVNQDGKEKGVGGRPLVFARTGGGGDDDDGREEGDTLGGTADCLAAAYDRKFKTRIFKAEGMELRGFSLPVAGVSPPRIWFQAYFLPDVEDDVKIEPRQEVKDAPKKIASKAKRWERDFAKFVQGYRQWFPNSPPTRNFCPVAEHPATRQSHSLSSFLTPFVLPEELDDDPELLHWVGCHSWIVPPRQIRTNEIGRGGWSPVAHTLLTFKGTVADHALLLCSALLGQRQDAYVCKGTVREGTVEHAWVMTREERGWIAFWEVTTRTKYYLPSRWQRRGASSPPPEYLAVEKGLKEVQEKAKAAVEDEIREAEEADQDDNPFTNGAYLNFMKTQYEGKIEWDAEGDMVTKDETQAVQTDGYAGAVEMDGGQIFEDEVAPQLIQRTDIEEGFFDEGRILAESDHTGRGKKKPAGKKGKADEMTLQEKQEKERQRLREFIRNSLESLPIAPDLSLCDWKTTLAFVPYSSVEIVFNQSNVWGNLQNHHPACIGYDVEDKWKWRKFLMRQEPPIDSEVTLNPPMSDAGCAALERALAEDLHETIRMHRAAKGLDTQSDSSDALETRVEQYVALLEFKLYHLDPLFDPGVPEGHVGWSAFQAKDFEKRRERAQKKEAKANEKAEAGEGGGEPLPQSAGIGFDDFDVGGAAVIDGDDGRRLSRDRLPGGSHAGGRGSGVWSPDMPGQGAGAEVEGFYDRVARGSGAGGGDDWPDADALDMGGGDGDGDGPVRAEAHMVKDALEVSKRRQAELLDKAPQVWFPPHLASEKKEYLAEQRKRWRYFYKMEEGLFKAGRKNFPVRANHSYTGFATHFASADPNHVKGYLWETRRFSALLDIPIDAVVFSAKFKVFSLPTGAVSVWMFFSTMVPWNEEVTRRRQRREDG